MNQQQYQSDLDRMMGMFNPGPWNILKWLWIILFEGSYFLLMVFFRYRIGEKLLTLSNWFRGSLLISLLWLLSGLAADMGQNYGAAAPQVNSMLLLWRHSVLFNFFFLWRWIANVYYLRNSENSNVALVPEEDIGDSVIYRTLYFLFSWTGIFSHTARPWQLWKITESRFMQVIEPVGIFLVGWHLSGLGYTAYSIILMIGAIAMAWVTFTALNNNARRERSKREAEYHGKQQSRREGSSHKRHVVGD